jgi:hypothetical protein
MYLGTYVLVCVYVDNILRVGTVGLVCHSMDKLLHSAKVSV